MPLAQPSDAAAPEGMRGDTTMRASSPTREGDEACDDAVVDAHAEHPVDTRLDRPS